MLNVSGALQGSELCAEVENIFFQLKHWDFKFFSRQSKSSCLEN